ncbi:MAG: AraC family transcriptional regulator [Gammaproteobacteria bacterium]|nr:AraC family transcriptional regulator [Gammaproteobacteria bacterium]
MRGWIAGILLVLMSGTAMAETLDEQIARLKADVVDINTSLYRLEQELLNPADTQLAVYMSLSAAEYFLVDAVELSLNGKMAESHLYTEQERKALSRGGVQRLYIGNIAAGTHKLTAVLNGKGVNDRYFRKSFDFQIRKEQDARQLELVITADPPTYEPVVKLKSWN